MSATAFSLTRLGPVLNRWKYLVGAAVLLAAIVSTVVALMLPNVYSSTAVFLPTPPPNADPDRLLVDANAGTRTMLELGARPEDLDRVITVGASQTVADIIIDKFNLYQHYEAGQRGDPAADNAVLNEFASNLAIEHNERDAIELRFMDEDKDLAARVANAMLVTIDSVNQQLTIDNRRTVLNLYRQRYEALRDTFEQSRQQLRAARYRYGIFDPAMQGRYLAKELIETETALRKAENGGGGNVTALRQALRGLTRADGGNRVNMESYVNGLDSVQMFNARVYDLSTRLVAARSAFESADLSIQARVSSIYVVQKAYPATRKTKPVRWLIVVSSVLGTFGLAVLLVALLELNRYRRLRLAPTR